MKVTIIYDNDAIEEELSKDWGFSCLVEAYNKKILFDTGADGSILLDNMKKLNIEPDTIDEVFISHDHWDHTGGLSEFLRINPVRVYIPSSCRNPESAKEVIKVKKPLEIHENIYSTGEIKNIEQSLAVKTEKGVVLIVGCSHSGVKNILDVANKWGDVYALIGGLHGFKDFSLLENLELVCATHCTQFSSEIKSRYPEKNVRGGAGSVIDI